MKLKCITITLGLLACAATGLIAAENGPTPYPDAKNPDLWPGQGPVRVFDWMTPERNKFWAKRDADQGKIVFTGDSLIGGWKLDKDFPGKPVANRGIGGDVTRGVLFRLQEDVLDLHPKAIVIHIGGNDLSGDASVETVVSNYNLILDQIQKANAQTPVLILAILPRGIPTGAKAPSPGLLEYLKKVNARIPQVDAELAKFPATRPNVTYVESYTPFLLPDGSVDASQYNDDMVHPTDAGHSKMAALVIKALTDLKLL